MNGNKILKLIQERWLKSERFELVCAVVNVSLGAATGGEAAAMTGSFLAQLETKDSEAYNEVGDLIIKYLDWCLKYGLSIRLASGKNYGK